MSDRIVLQPAVALVNTVAFWLAMTLAAAAWWPIYQNLQFVIVVAVGILVGSTIAALGALLRWSSAVVAPVMILAFAILGVPLAVPDKALYGVLPTLDGALDLFSAVALAWKQLLTIALPVGSYQALLVPVLVLTLLGSVVGLSLALRSRVGDLAGVVPVVIFIAGLAFGGRESLWPMPLALGLLATLLVWLLWRRWYRRRQSIRETQGMTTALLGMRRVLGALIVIALAGGAAYAVTLALPPTTPREVLRQAIEQPFDPRSYPSPLAAFRQYLRPESADAVMLRVTGLPEGERIRIATLDSYDGVVFAVGSSLVSSESGSFTRVPYAFDQTGLAGDHVTIEVTIGAYTGPWVPTVGAFEGVEFTGARATELRDSFYYNDTARTAAVLAGMVQGDSYELEVVLPAQPSAAELRSLSPGSARVPVAEVPAELSTVLERYTSGVDGQGARLVAAVEGLRAEGYISHGLNDDEPPSRSGHASDRITQLLSDQRMIGDEEQYAVTAAIMARQLGFPSRVVFGFVPDESGIVRGDAVTAWIEVSTAQYGWVALDVTPPPRDIPEAEPEEPSQVSRPQAELQPPDEETDLSDNQTPIESTQDAQPALDGWVEVLLAVARVLGISLLVITLLVSPFVVIIAAKLRRRYLRRRAESPLQQITGGWREFEDAVVDHGIVPPKHATRSELARAIGGSTTLQVAELADRAIFAPGGPSLDEAQTVWRSVDELTRSLDEGLTGWQRLKARVSVRSLSARRAPQRPPHRARGRR
jgi:hypothetical protein